jgi:hypothetical protein
VTHLRKMMLEELQRRHYSELTALRRRAGGLPIIQAANSLRLRMSTASRRIPIQSPTNTERPNRADANKIQGCEWHERAILAHRSK